MLRGEAKRFSLAALMVLITVFAAWLAVTMAMPWLGTAIAAFVAPALLRTHQVAAFHRSTGRSFDLEQHMAAFFRSLGLVLFLAIVGMVSFVMAALVIHVLMHFFWLRLLGDLAGEVLGAVVFIGAGVATLVVLGFVAWPLWPAKRYDYTALELWRHRDRREIGVEKDSEREP